MDPLSFRTDMMPSIDRIRLSSPKHAGARMQRHPFQCSRKSKRRVLDASTAQVNGNGLLPSIPQPPHIIPRNQPRRKSTSLSLVKNPRHLPLNNNLQPLNFLWIRKRIPRNRNPTPSRRLGFYFGRKASSPKVRRRRCLFVELLAGIRRTKGRRKAKERTSRSPGS